MLVITRGYLKVAISMGEHDDQSRDQLRHPIFGHTPSRSRDRKTENRFAMTCHDPKNRGWIASLSESMRPICTVLWVQAEFAIRIGTNGWKHTHTQCYGCKGVYTNKNRNGTNHCRTEIGDVLQFPPIGCCAYHVKILTECQVFVARMGHNCNSVSNSFGVGEIQSTPALGQRRLLVG